jgi:hypothetical protein
MMKIRLPVVSPQDRLEKILDGTPVNSVARRVTAPGWGEVEAEPPINWANHEHFTEPPPMREHSTYWNPDLRKLYTELINKQFGSLQVIGLAMKRTKKGESRFVVKCTCGSYEYRSTKAIRRALRLRDNLSTCQRCGAMRSRRYNPERKKIEK